MSMKELGGFERTNAYKDFQEFLKDIANPQVKEKLKNLVDEALKIEDVDKLEKELKGITDLASKGNTSTETLNKLKGIFKNILQEKEDKQTLQLFARLSIGERREKARSYNLDDLFSKCEGHISKLSPFELEIIALKAKDVVDLDLSKCSQMDPSDLELLPEFPHLGTLHLPKKTMLTDEDKGIMATKFANKFSQIHTLDASGSTYGGVMCHMLQKKFFPKVATVNLANSTASYAALDALSNRQIGYLTLSANHIDFTNLEPLKKLALKIEGYQKEPLSLTIVGELDHGHQMVIKALLEAIKNTHPWTVKIKNLP